MKRALLGRHRRLLFRSYLLLVLGLLTVAAVLDFGFGMLQSSQDSEQDRWLSSSFGLIEKQLAGVPPGDRAAVAAEIATKIGFGVQILDRDDLVLPAGPTGDIEILVDADGNSSYLRNAPSLNGHIRLGPVEPQRESIFLRMLPPLFYLSIFVIVGIWLQPLLKDLNLITSAAHRFASDYRKPLATAADTTQLTSLAKHLDEMSARLSGLIQSQKELIAALSHEMRTPLARIRFALAVIGNNDVGNNGNGELGKQLDELNNDVQEIDQLIATMLNYARLDHPDLRMNWQRVPLDAWLTQIKDKCLQPGTKLDIERDSAFAFAWMDPYLMGLALSNLLTNAGRYAQRQVRCAVLQHGTGYEIRIEDDGKGIPESERETVFKAFTRLDDSRNRETGGYGLGLAVVARIANLHGGNVTAQASGDLGGAKFVLRWARPE